MNINPIFIILLITILCYYYLSTIINYTQIKKKIYKVILVKNKNYILLHFKNMENNENKIYKIYKNKFIL